MMRHKRLIGYIAGTLVLLMSAVFTSGLAQSCAACTSADTSVASHVQSDHACCAPQQTDLHCNTAPQDDCLSCAQSEFPEPELVSYTVNVTKQKLISADFTVFGVITTPPQPLLRKRTLKLPRSDLSQAPRNPLDTIRLNC